MAVAVAAVAVAVAVAVEVDGIQTRPDSGQAALSMVAVGGGEREEGGVVGVVGEVEVVGEDEWSIGNESGGALRCGRTIVHNY